MPTTRHAPGERVIAGTYALVTHNGEGLDISVQVGVGQHLPRIAVTGVNPVWFIRIGDTASNS